MAGSVLKWVTVFDKDKNCEIEIPDMGDHVGDKNNKRLSVERIYQKKSQLEHILLRPDTYIGSVAKDTQTMWVFDDEADCMVNREITYVPGLYKIFDEILVNAADNKQRDDKMSTLKIDIDPEANKIKVWNNGKGIPVIEHKTEKMFVPTLIFGHLLTSSNFDDSEKKVTGGRNGYGAKLCNVFSTKFIVETQSNEYKKAFKQVWNNNMSKSSEPKIVASKGEDYTAVTFYPDLAKFKMDKLDKDIVDLMTRRAYDIAATTKGVKVFLNGKKLPIKNFKDYVELYTKGKVDDNDCPLKVVHDVVNPRWEIALTLSEKGFQNVSFVNSIATTKGGRHVDYVTDHLVSKLIEVVKKKEKKGGIQIKPFQVKNHLWVFVNCLIENPTFDSQTKENMTLQAKQFGSKCALTEKFITQVGKCGIVESIMSWMRFKQQAQLNKKMSSAKHSKLKGVPKLDDANDAGTRNSIECTLILTEGDSAKTLAVAGLGVIGRDRYGVFPLRGKVLNVREATHKQIMENAEINNIIKILGLRYKEKYDSPESMKTLRYGKIMIMTDQDQDGSHIKGLLINFIHHNWPHLLKQTFLEEFITPIVKVTKGKHQEHSFYSLPEFEEWKKDTDNWHTWKIKYYKGLGTSTSKEAKEYFMAMKRHRIPFKYAGGEDDTSILLAFSKKKIEERKEWLTNWMEERKRRSQLGLPELFLYGKETKCISYNEFVNRELILFSNMDNERSIPSLIDGLKPGQRKVLFTCLKRNLTKEVKVAQFAGSVAEHSAYHHGEQSLMTTIINLAQNFVGSNNINLLQPLGQFGTRLHGGKDAASPRYIFTMLSTLTRLVFNVHDDPLLKSLFDDNLRIEPEWYIPILPMVLVNGADGIGTGWSTRIPNHDPREIVRNLFRMMDNEQPITMLPSFKNFKGTIDQLEEKRYLFNGEVNIIDDQTIEITELPIKTWTQVYKENVLEPMLQGTDKIPAFIQDYKEYHTDTTVRFVVKLSGEKLAQAEEQGLHKVFKLQTPMSLNSMVLFDANGCIKRYDNVEEMLKEFYEVRLDFYKRRKDYLEGMLAAESLKLDNIARFICEKIEGTIVIENKPKKEIMQMLTRRGYDPDPVKTWKEAQNKLQAMEEFGADGDDDSQSSTVTETSGSTDFNYLLSLPLWCLTKEKKEELLKQRDQKAEELYQLKKKTPKGLWRNDLEVFLKELDAVEQKEQEDDMAGNNMLVKAAKGAKGRPKFMHRETKPSPMGRRVEPKIDPTLRLKAEQAAAKKKKAQERKEAGLLVNDDSVSVDGSEPKSLAERIGMKGTKLGNKDKGQPNIFDAFSKAKKKPLNQKLDMDTDPDSDFDGLSNGTKTTKVLHKKRMDLSPKKPSAGNKRPRQNDSDSELSESEYRKKSPKKFKKPFDSDSEDDTKPKKGKKSASDSDDFELEEDFKLAVEPRQRAGRQRKPMKYNFGESDGEKSDSDDDMDDEMNNSNYQPSSPAKTTSDIFPQASDNEEDMISDIESSPIKPSKQTVNTNKAMVLSDSDDDFKPETVESDEDDIWGNAKAIKAQPKKAAPKKAAFKKAEPQKAFTGSDSDDEFHLDSSPEHNAAPKKTFTISDSDDDDFNPDISPKVKAKPKPRKKKADSDDDLFGEKPKKVTKKAAPKKKTDDKPKKAAPKKRAPKKKSDKKVPSFSDSEDEDDFSPSKFKESDDEFVAARATTGRSRKPVKYNFGAESNESDSDY